MNRGLEADARRAVELGNDDALGAVDHESALWSHERELAHVNFFFLRAAFVLVAEGHIKRGAEGLAFALGFERGHFGFAELVADEVEGGFVLETMDREKFAENGLNADIPALTNRNIPLEKLVVGINLELDEVRWLDGLFQFTELDAFRHGFGAVPRVGLAGFSRPGSFADHWKQKIRHR